VRNTFSCLHLKRPYRSIDREAKAAASADVVVGGEFREGDPWAGAKFLIQPTEKFVSHVLIPDGLLGEWIIPNYSHCFSALGDSVRKLVIGRDGGS